MNHLIKLTSVGVLAAALSACGSLDKQERRVAKGAAIGAVSGLILTGGEMTGALAGAAAGGVAGHQYDRHQEKKNR
ncbi:osmotically inducible lipoprotein OsmB [Neisseria sp. HSC-16F19]|nr:glycine zipper domain-containing protein [Neisseria sp. HSC-16F19]MCP2041573.1 osmotically inducible lipoprotein OsmB [Neisseria sp. HSC-16F19]